MTQGMRAAGLLRDPAEDNRRISGLDAGEKGRQPAQIAAIVVLLVLNIMFWLFQFTFYRGDEYLALPIVRTAQSESAVTPAKPWCNAVQFFSGLTILTILSAFTATATDSRDPMLIYIPVSLCELCPVCLSATCRLVLRQAALT
jgi:hypothetical protein